MLQRPAFCLCLLSFLLVPDLVVSRVAIAESSNSETDRADSNNAGFRLSEIQAGSAPELTEDTRFRTGWVWVDPVREQASELIEDSHISKIIYLNRCTGGCNIQPGANNSLANTSSIPSATSVLSEYKWTQEKWDATVACVRDVYSPYDVEIVTEDPGAVPHHESIVAGLPGDIGLAANIGGIAPSSCQPLNNVISFSFANSPASNGGDPLTVCWTIAQESAHSFGLPNHVFNCIDPMTYLPGCGKKFFRNQNLPCGEFQLSPCNCSGVTQNSHVELSTVFGPGTLPPPPELEILLPKDGTTVDDGFTIFWSSQDERLIKRSEIWINGTKYKDIPGKGFDKRFENYDTPAPSIPDGVINLEIRSYNEVGSESIKSVTITKGAPCADASTCFAFQECNEGRCEYGAAAAELGDACDVDPQCNEGVCAEVGGVRACSSTCNPNVTGACLDGFSCQTSATGGAVCWAKGTTGGCCSVAGSKSDPLPWFGLGLFVVGLALLRRRQRS